MLSCRRMFSVSFPLFILLLQYNGVGATATTCENASTVALRDIVTSTTAGLPRANNTNLEFSRCSEDGIVSTGTPGVWFLYQPLESRTVIMSWCDFSAPHRLTVFADADSSACSQATCLASVESSESSQVITMDHELYSSCPLGTVSTLSLNTSSTLVYWLFVHDSSLDDSGDFVWTLTDSSDPPSNDSCETAQSLVLQEVTPGTTSGSNSEFFTGDTVGVFYRITTPSSSDVRRSHITLTGASQWFDADIYSVSDESSCDISDGSFSASPNVTVEILEANWTRLYTWESSGDEEYVVYVYATGEATVDGSDVVPTGRFGILWTMSNMGGAGSGAKPRVSFEYGFVFLTFAIFASLLDLNFFCL